MEDDVPDQDLLMPTASDVGNMDSPVLEECLRSFHQVGLNGLARPLYDNKPRCKNQISHAQCILMSLYPSHAVLSIQLHF